MIIPTVTILEAIKARLLDAKWTPEGGVEEAAFGEVHLFDGTDLVEAFTELIISKARVALVIYTGGRFEASGAGGSAGYRRMPVVSVVVSDRVLGRKRESIFGGPTNPGAIRLMELAAAALTGRLINDPPCDCRPVSDDLLVLEDLRTKQPGRHAALLELSLSGGLIEVPDPFVAAA